MSDQMAEQLSSSFCSNCRIPLHWRSNTMVVTWDYLCPRRGVVSLVKLPHCWGHIKLPFSNLSYSKLRVQSELCWRQVSHLLRGLRWL